MRVQRSKLFAKTLPPLRGCVSPLFASRGLRPWLLTVTPPGLNGTIRSGATLVEVLVAIFVMAIGLLALLALFPLGVIRMAQAIQDGRASQSALNGREIALLKRVRYDTDNELQQGLMTAPDSTTQPPVDMEGPSYPVLVDPLGFISASAVTGTPSWLAADINTNIRRSSVSYVGNSFSAAQRWFTLLDDVSFEPDGTARKIGATIEREINYSWAYMLQRPRAGDASVVDLSTVVFKGRSVSLTGDLTLSESSYSGAAGSPGTAYFNPADNRVLFDYSGAGQVAPALRPGDWILDCTPVLTLLDPATPNRRILASTSDPAKAPQFRTAHGNFYRVVGVDELSDTQLEVEVETPLRGFPAVDTADPNFNFAINGQTVYKGVVVILENVAEVFDDGPGRQP